MVIPIPTRRQRVERIKKDWGYEHVIANDNKYCLKVLQLTPGKQSSLHYHAKKDEMFLVVFGSCWLEVGKRRRHLIEGCFQRIRPGTPHRLSFPKSQKGIGCLLVEVSTIHDDSDVFRIEKSGPCNA